MTMKAWIKEQEVTLGELFYLLSFAPLLFAKGIGLYDGQRIFTVFVAVAFAFGIGKLLITKYTVRDILWITGLVILSAIVYKVSCEKGILFYVWMIIGMKNVRLKTVMQWGLKIWSAAFCGIFFLSLFHIHDTVYKVHEKLGLGHIFRWSMGYPHPNVLHISYLVLLLFIVYHLRERFNWKICLLMFMGNCYIFMYSVSYTGFAIVTLYLAGNMYWIYRKKLAKPERIICEFIFPLCVLLSIGGPILLTGKAFDIINRLLNTRLYLSGLFLKWENITLFGNNIGQITSAVATMDNSYVYGLIAYGVIVFTLLAAGYMILIHSYVKQQKGIELLIIFAVLAAGLTEPFLFNTSYKNVTLLFMGEVLFAQSAKGRDIFLHFRGKALEDNRIRLKGIDFHELGAAWKAAAGSKKLYFTLVSAVIAFVCVVIYTRSAVEYSGVIVPREHCADIEEDSSIYIDGDSADLYEDYLILDYEDAAAPMELFEGNILKVDMLRGTVSSGIFGYVISYYAMVTAVLVCKRRTRGRDEK